MKVTLSIVVLVILLGGFLLFKNQQSSPVPVPQTIDKTKMQYIFEDPKKSAHYESNTPEHGTTLAGVPINVVINFNFDLAKPSSIIIFPWNEGREIGIDMGVGETIIDSNKLSMRRKMNTDSSDDLYTVSYKACWPDGSCHDGNFQFVIDRSLAETFTDETNEQSSSSSKKEVEIKMSEIAFKPANIKLSQGTKVTWINDEVTVHYVNTDSHPGHSYYLNQNSKALSKGDSYSVTFDKSGIYPYHCSAHADNMTGNILVE